MSKLLGDGPITGVDSLAVDWAAVHMLWEVDAIEEIAVQIQHGGKAHGFPLGGGARPGMDHGTINQNFLVQMGFKVLNGQMGPQFHGHQRVIATEREAQELQLVVGILNGIRRQSGQCKIFVSWLEEQSLWSLLFLDLGLEYGLPEHFFLGYPKTPKGIDAHQDGQLFHGNGHPIDKIIKISELPVKLPFGQQPLDQGTFQVFQLSKPKIYVPPIDHIDMVAQVDAGWVEGASPHFCLMDVEFGVEVGRASCRERV